MEKPNVAVLGGFGVNSQIETQFAFSLAGADARIIHLNDLLSSKESISNFHCLVFPGGFSFGDDISSGKIYGNKFATSLFSETQSFLKEKKLVLGICNGFQSLVKMGLLPNISGGFTQEATIFSNASGKFEDRWVYLKANAKSKCIFTKGIGTLYLPVRHGEGQFIAKDDAVMQKLKSNGQISFQYVDANGRLSGYPWNPNGAQENIAGICDPTGRVFGLMPHPECHIFQEQHPRFYRGESGKPMMGINIFENAVNYMKRELL